MDKKNIILPIKLPQTKFTFNEGTNLIDYLKENYTSWYLLNKKDIDTTNSIRLYALTGDVGVLIDGNIATIDNSLIIEEGVHFIENVNLKKISIIAPGSVIIQIGIIG